MWKPKRTAHELTALIKQRATAAQKAPWPPKVDIIKAEHTAKLASNSREPGNHRRGGDTYSAH
jgi:hypothetical protein